MIKSQEAYYQYDLDFGKSYDPPEWDFLIRIANEYPISRVFGFE